MTTTSRPDALAPGTRLGPYEIVALIGAGGMGAVYRARDPRLDRDVAVKVLPPAVAMDPDRLARFETEARAVGRLEHPNVLVVYDVGRHGAIPYLVTELLEGETIATRLKGGPLPVRKTVEYAAQIARGLAAAHAKGIIHRDLKPENLFLTTDDRVKILDFGLAKLAVPLADAPTAPIAPQTDAGIVLGTVGYMSPEQVRGEPLDARTDIFSLGAVTHEMLGGARAFSRSTSIETMNAILKEDAPDLPPSVHPGLDRIVRRCLEKRREDRFHSAHDLGLALEAQSMSGDRTSSIAPLPASRLWTRRRAIAVGAGGLGLLSLGAGAALLVDRRTAPLPSYRRLTFRRGLIRSARFAPDGQTILYGALWDGEPCRIHSVRTDSPESRPVDFAQANLLAISSKGEIALALGSHFEGIFTYGTLARVPLAGGAPREILEDVKFADWSPDGSELAIVRRVGGNDRLEYPVGNVLLEARGGLGFMRVSPDGGRVAIISGSLSGSVTVVDRTGAATPLTEEYRHIHGLAWNKDEIWYTAADERPLFRSLQAVTLSGDRRPLAHVPGNATLHDVSRDGVVLLAHTDDRQGILVVSPDSQNERDLSWLDASALSDMSPDGRFILFTEFGQGGGAANSVYLRRTDGAAAVRLGGGRAIALSPDVRWALCFDAASKPVLLPTGAGEARRISTPLRYRSARWLPDGRRLVVSADEEGRAPRLHVADFAGDTHKPITPEGAGAWALSPDGRTVAVRGPDRAIRLFPVAGGEARAVPATTGREVPIGWINEGLLVTHDDAPEYSLKMIFRLNPATGEQVLWKRIEPHDQAGLMFLYQFRVTPDGGSYAYSWHRAISDLYLVNGV